MIELLGDRVDTMEHEMKTRGCQLKEIKQKIFVDSQFKSEMAIHEKTIIVHLRTILDDQYGSMGCGVFKRGIQI